MLAGPHQISVEAFDKEGNQADPVSTELYIYREEAPLISIQESSMAIFDTTQFKPSGLVNAFNGLASIESYVEKDGQQLYQNNWAYTGGVFQWSLDSVPQVSISPNFQLATFTVIATDLLGNITYETRVIQP